MDAPQVTDFQTYFERDFPFGDDDDTVTDSDVQRAITEAGININEGLFTSQDQFTVAYLYLAAHNLVTNIMNSTRGLAAKAEWLTISKAVGPVSSGFQIPERIMKNPTLAAISQTTYGMRYLEIVLPRLVGQVFVVRGGTTP